MDRREKQQDIGRIAALDHPIRAALYATLTEHDGWLGRDDAAAHVGSPRSVAAFHLDKLVRAGLVETRFERTSGRTGPGAGRPSKLYRRVRNETVVSVPDRRYPLVGHLLADAIDTATKTGRPVKQVLARLAKRTGTDIAKRSERTDVVDVLADIGYEPHDEDGAIVLRNCPFHDLAREHTDLVCGMNLDLVRGVCAGTPDCRYKAHLRPAPDTCCVRLEPT